VRTCKGSVLPEENGEFGKGIWQGWLLDIAWANGRVNSRGASRNAMNKKTG